MAPRLIASDHRRRRPRALHWPALSKQPSSFFGASLARRRTRALDFRWRSCRISLASTASLRCVYAELQTCLSFLGAPAHSRWSLFPASSSLPTTGHHPSLECLECISESDAVQGHVRAAWLPPGQIVHRMPTHEWPGKVHRAALSIMNRGRRRV